MATLPLPFPVRTLDNQELLPSGGELSDDGLEELVSRGMKAAGAPAYLLGHGGIREDLLRCIGAGSYRSIFGETSRKRKVLSLMERVEVTPEVLRVLDYFKRHDPYTYRHKLTVFALSALLALDLVEDAEDVLRNAESGPAHDVGKICVPLPVLKKKQALTTREHRLLEHHVVAGYVLLSYYLGDARNLSAVVARDHHERRDGSGYPLGVSQEDRLVEIVAVSDIYDALVSPRPYRENPFDNRTALEEITGMAEQDKVSWDVVRLLVALNRRNKPFYTECAVSVEKRGRPPAGNVWGVTVPGENGDNRSP